MTPQFEKAFIAGIRAFVNAMGDTTYDPFTKQTVEKVSLKPTPGASPNVEISPNGIPVCKIHKKAMTKASEKSLKFAGPSGYKCTVIVGEDPATGKKSWCSEKA